VEEDRVAHAAGFLEVVEGAIRLAEAEVEHDERLEPDERALAERRDLGQQASRLVLPPRRAVSEAEMEGSRPRLAKGSTAIVGCGNNRVRSTGAMKRYPRRGSVSM